MWTHRGLFHLLGWWALLLFVLTQAQDCSSDNPCATGCCSKDGYCGIGDDYCGADVCVASCDYKPDCDASNPCATGCCNKYGYCGLGPDYCDSEVCVAGCESKSYCDPGGFGEFSEVSKCPLNVCCSKFGFCGLTEEFCGKKKVKRPSCEKAGSLNRVVGYYEGWSVKRPCNVFYPEQIPMGVYTHLNYAFAAIDPDTFEIQPASTYEGNMMKRLTGLKRIDPDLKVFVAIGGWTFNDPGPTATVFSDLARSKDNQDKFFNSLTSFLAKYDFDGVDLDWEYPAADDRSGREEDFENFPKFMANLKDALKKTAGRDGLSITLPASYWYLQHFDIVKLEKHIDFFNMMTYDLHGTWDKGNKWLGEYLLAHTNLTEITNGLDLLWRNDISPEKVVLGMAFYARAFTVSDTSCMDTGCLFDSGANAGKCSHEVGILLNSEIIDIMDDGDLKSELDKEAAVKILKYDTNQWLTYDDGDTFKLKADFARGQCLGGVMVWAVSHDTKDGKFTRALSEAVGRKAVALAMTSESPDDTKVVKYHPQCKWTNCMIDCPSGWSRVARGDDGHRTDEHMWDETGCGGAGEHTLCCPPDADLPTCGWYTHNNGKCDPTCPDGMVEVGSNSMYCNNGKYQAACCTTNTNSTKLYGQCSWSEWPMCDDGSCSNTEIASSTTGSGGASCNMRAASLDGSIWEVQERKYCCDKKDDEQWEDCEWKTDIGLALAGHGVSNGYCLSGCPDDTVRVALDKWGGDCVGRGARAKCCKADFNTITKRAYTDEEEDLAELVQEFMDDQTCGSNSWYLKREVDFHLEHGNLTSLAMPMPLTRRSSLKSQEKMEDLLKAIAVQYGASVVKRDIWDEYVVSEYENLTPANLRSWINDQITTITKGYSYLVESLICNMAYYNAVIGEKEVISCACETKDCCDNDDDYCSSDDGYDYTELSLSIRSLEKRAGSRSFDITFSDGRTMHYTSLGYWSRGQVPVNHPLMQLGFDFVDQNDCLLPDVTPTALTTTTRRRFAVEHELELNTIRQFIMDAANGVLRSGATARTGAISITFFVQAMTAPILNNPPAMLGGTQSFIPIVRVMNALGSTANNGHFVFFLNGLNNMKLQLWVGKDPINSGTMDTAIQATDPKTALNNLRSALSLIYYLNHPIAHDNWVGPANDVRTEWARAETEWFAQGNGREQVVAFWDEWLRDFMNGRATRIRNWVQNWARQMYGYWAVRTGNDAIQTLQALRTINSLASDLEMDLDGLYQEPLDLD
ncbi:Glycoside hydrolase, superfamily [Penicillium griseofulvum]|uniref:chitinase n=1 Tax=Penicillium patulum TaxID=5078 RepID=A0A135LCG9_PENPA|nr:Glycoside hydrolase, superfamily [Penicillium griseofulvum]KXG46667.1 Glycoside hydrolase, superfamily [Penicillium griseofulvum]